MGRADHGAGRALNQLLPRDRLPAPPPEDVPAPGVGISLGPLALNSEILVPDDGQRLPAGPTVISGYALAGDDRAVSRVDVSVDGGATWQQAELADALSP